MLKIETALTGAIGQGCNATVVLVTTTIEHHSLDLLFLCPACEQFAHLTGSANGLGRAVRLHIRLTAGGRSQSVTVGVIDQLGINEPV